MKHEREKEYVSAAAGITKEIIKGTGEALSGLLRNQIAGTAFFIVAATATYPGWFPIVRTATATIAKDIATAIHDNVLPDVTAALGRDDAKGTFGIEVVATDGSYDPSQERFYDNSTSRDTAMLLLALNPIGGRIVSVTRTVKVFSDGGIVTGTPMPLSPKQQAEQDALKGKWAIIWPSAPGGPTVVGYYSNQSDAEFQSAAYNKTYNRDSYVKQA